jgi:monofunctional biosynthetic peptidoglycan transglycosylase
MARRQASPARNRPLKRSSSRSAAAKRSSKASNKATGAERSALSSAWRSVLRVIWRLSLLTCVLVFLIVGLLRWVDPPGGIYMWSEARRLDGIAHRWVEIDEIAPALRRSVVAAEDANFCTHMGFDIPALRAAIKAGGSRGASTITQQTVKNLFLWHGRSYGRKLIEAALTPVVELLWPKRRILEVYLNIVEWGDGVFGAEAASQSIWDERAASVSRDQAARMAFVLPAPKTRDAARLTQVQLSRAERIADGASTIAADGRAECFD